MMMTGRSNMMINTRDISRLCMFFVFLCYDVSVALPTLPPLYTVTGSQVPTTVSTLVDPDTNHTDDQSDCVIEAANPNLYNHFESLLKDDAKLIEIDIIFQNYTANFPQQIKSDVFRPLHWVHTTGRHGQGLLMLKTNYDVLSLAALTFGVEAMNVTLNESPPGCFTGKPMKEIEHFLRDFLMSGFQIPDKHGNYSRTTHMESTEHFCNSQIRDDGGSALFVYTCCNKDPDGKTICKDLKEDKWITILFTAVFILKVLVFLNCPLLIPESWYRLKYISTEYVSELKTSMTLNVVVTQTPQRYTYAKQTMSISKFSEMTRFKNTLERLNLDSKTFLSVSSAHILVKAARMLSSLNAPVGLARSFYNSVVRCEIRHKEHAKNCCTSNMFGTMCCSQERFPWYKCLKNMMRIFVLIVLVFPWIIRIVVFFQTENEGVVSKFDAAAARGLQMTFRGSIILYLTPIHVLFIVVYGILLVDAAVFGVLGRQVKTKLKYSLGSSLRDMREKSRSDAFGWVFFILMQPFKTCGIFGLIIGIPYWLIAIPVITVTAAFYMFPTLNLTVRLLAQMIINIIPENSRCHDTKFCQLLRQCGYGAKDKLNLGLLTNKEELKRSPTNQLLHILIMFMCLVTMYSVLLLFMETISFFVEVAVYTFMGIILNADRALEYATLGFLLIIYARDCLGDVTKKYNAFYKVILDILQQRAGGELEKVALHLEEVQKETAFRIKPDILQYKEKPPIELVQAGGYPNWKANGLVLFLNKRDTLYVPERFFFKLCHLPHHGCPGKLYANYFNAAVRFSLILVFLCFVLIVVLAFGDIYNISTSNQMLATLAGGFLPWILKDILFKSPDTLTLDKDNLSFNNHFSHALEKFGEKWPISDIHVDLDSAHAPPPASSTSDQETPIDLVIDVSQTDPQSFFATI